LTYSEGSPKETKCVIGGGTGKELSKVLKESEVEMDNEDTMTMIYAAGNRRMD
jgi:proteasome assembly chaperone (PAC2) family protein